MTSVEPLVLPDDGPNCVSSPKMLSPDDSSYNCGTMKSDDSGIVMDDSQLNFSGDQSDLMFSSAEVSPIEEDNHIISAIHEKKYIQEITETSRSPPEVYIEQIEENHTTDTTDEQVTEFFKSTEQEEEIRASSADEQESEPLTIEEEQPASTDQISEEIEDQETDDTETANQETDDIEVTNQETDDKDLSETTPEIEEEEPEEERVDFVKGLRCDDVYTAIEILKTKYRLSNTSVRKFIITFSSWNVSQISHPISNRCSWWDDSQHMPEENDEIGDLTEDIYTRQGEISELVDRIMEEEKLKHDFAIQLAKQAEREKEEAEIKPEEVITVESAAPTHTSPAEVTEDDDVFDDNDSPQADEDDDDNKDSADKKGNKKKNRNALQRFIHAVSKRIRRNRSTGEKDRAKA